MKKNINSNAVFNLSISLNRICEILEVNKLQINENQDKWLKFFPEKYIEDNFVITEKGIEDLTIFINEASLTAKEKNNYEKLREEMLLIQQNTITKFKKSFNIQYPEELERIDR